jgi:FixJ family two-component response regulator
MNSEKPMVFVIDDNESLRKALQRLLTGADYEVEIFRSASDFLSRSPYFGPSCVVVDVKMPGLSGIDLQNTLIQRRREEQLVFITGHGDVPTCARAMKAGAVDFLRKPFKPKELLNCVEHALARSAEQRQHATERGHARALLDRLTPREFEVMQLLATGMLNKQVGGELGMAEKTVKCHRGRVMQKLGITSAVQLVYVMEKAKVPALGKSPTKVR